MEKNLTENDHGKNRKLSWKKNKQKNYRGKKNNVLAEKMTHFHT